MIKLFVFVTLSIFATYMETVSTMNKVKKTTTTINQLPD